MNIFYKSRSSQFDEGTTDVPAHARALERHRSSKKTDSNKTMGAAETTQDWSGQRSKLNELQLKRRGTVPESARRAQRVRGGRVRA